MSEPPHDSTATAVPSRRCPHRTTRLATETPGAGRWVRLVDFHQEAFRLL